MNKVTLSDLYQMALAANSKITNIYLHWSAGRYGQFFEDYHINIDADGSIYISTNDLTTILAHTWRRNTGAIGVALACCYNGDTNDLGPEPPTKPQIESMAQVVECLSKGLGLSIDSTVVMTHGEAAIIDGYGLGSGDPQTRWDLLFLSNDTKDQPGGDILRGKAIWYQQNGGI